MENNNIAKITIERIKELTNEGCFIGNDLAFFDRFEDIPFPLEPRRMNCVLAAICLKGRAQYTVDTKECTIGENDVIILSDGQVVSDFMLSSDCKGVVMMACENFMQDISKSIRETSSLFIYSKTHPVLHLNKQESKSFLEIYKLAKAKVTEKNHHFQREIVCTLLGALVYDIGNDIRRNQQEQTTFKQSRGEMIFSKFLKLVEQNFKQIRRVGWYANELGITPKYLSETVKKVSKETPNSWIDSYVTTELRLLLKNSSKNIKEIAKEMNFPNQSFLGKYFKDRTGMSPSDYRRS